MHGKISSNATKKLACSLVFKKKKEWKPKNWTIQPRNGKITVKSKLCTHKYAGWKWTVNRWPKEKKRISRMAGNGIESNPPIVARINRERKERKKERKGGEGRFKKERTTDKTVLTQWAKGTWTWDEEERKKLAFPFSLTFPAPSPDLPLSAANLLPSRVSYRSYRSSQRDADNRDFHSLILPHRWWPWRNCFRDKWNLFFCRRDGKRVWRKLDLLSPRTFSISERKTDVFQLLISLPLPPRGISILIFFSPSPTPSSPRTFHSVSRINLHSFGNKLEYCLRRDKYLQLPFMNVTFRGRESSLRISTSNGEEDLRETPERTRGSRERYYQLDTHLVCPSRARYEPFRLVYAVIWPTTTDLNSHSKSYTSVVPRLL